MRAVNPRRSYTSPLRTQQAATTRRAVLDAARELFLERGYGATTIDHIAARAGVSKPTVFAAVGNKQALLHAVRDVAIAGDDAPIPVAQRPAAVAVREAADQRQAVQRLAEHLTDVATRYAPIHEVLRGAAHSGPEDLRRLWELEEQQRLVGARHWIDVLATKGRLRDDVGRSAMTDVLWLLMAPDNFYRLVHGRRWPKARYRRWLEGSINAQVCGDSNGVANPPPRQRGR